MERGSPSHSPQMKSSCTVQHRPRSLTTGLWVKVSEDQLAIVTLHQPFTRRGVTRVPFRIRITTSDVDMPLEQLKESHHTAEQNGNTRLLHAIDVGTAREHRHRARRQSRTRGADGNITVSTRRRSGSYGAGTGRRNVGPGCG